MGIFKPKCFSAWFGIFIHKSPQFQGHDTVFFLFCFFFIHIFFNKKTSLVGELFQEVWLQQSCVAELCWRCNYMLITESGNSANSLLIRSASVHHCHFSRSWIFPALWLAGIVFLLAIDIATYCFGMCIIWTEIVFNSAVCVHWEQRPIEFYFKHTYVGLRGWGPTLQPWPNLYK